FGKTARCERIARRALAGRWIDAQDRAVEPDLLVRIARFDFEAERAQRAAFRHIADRRRALVGIGRIADALAPVGPVVARAFAAAGVEIAVRAEQQRADRMALVELVPV